MATAAPARAAASMAGFADDCAALLDRLGCGPVHLVGISMGGMIGFQLACDRPDLLRSLTIVNSTPEVIPRKPREHLEVAKRRLLSRLLSLRTIGRALGRLLFPKAEQAGLRERSRRAGRRTTSAPTWPASTRSSAGACRNDWPRSPVRPW